MMSQFLLLLLPFASADSVLSTPYYVTRFMAKEYCSCRYVVKQSETTCRLENKTTSLLFRLREDEDAKVVKVSNLIAKAEARFVSERHGCILVPDRRR